MAFGESVKAIPQHRLTDRALRLDMGGQPGRKASPVLYRKARPLLNSPNCCTRFGTFRGLSPMSLSDGESESECVVVCVCVHIPLKNIYIFLFPGPQNNRKMVKITTTYKAFPTQQAPFPSIVSFHPCSRDCYWPVLQMGKLRHRKVKNALQGLTSLTVTDPQFKVRVPDPRV